MAWTSVSPVGSQSVKANRPAMAANTVYIETTMGNVAAGTNTASTPDHFWNISSALDGHHRHIRSPKFEKPAGTAADPAIGTGMDGVQYIKLVNSDVARVECFYRNSQGIYQTSPSYITGTFSSSSAYTNVGATAIPINCYGEIFCIADGGTRKYVQKGYFFSDTTKTYTFASREKVQGTSEGYFLEFANGSDSTNLFIRAKRGGVTSNADGTWTYFITFRSKV